MARGTRTQGGRRTRICACANCGHGRPLVILPRRAETTVCRTFTIAHVNATHPSSELDVVSVLSKNLSPVSERHIGASSGTVTKHLQLSPVHMKYTSYTTNAQSSP